METKKYITTLTTLRPTHTVRQMLFINQTIPAKNQLEGLVVFHIFMSEGIIFGEQKLKEL